MAAIPMNQLCPLCRVVLERGGRDEVRPELWVVVKYENRWWQYFAVCGRCFQHEWREFKHDGELVKGYGTSREEKDKILHYINVSYCDSLAVHVWRIVARVNHGAIESAEPVIDRSFRGDS